MDNSKTNIGTVGYVGQGKSSVLFSESTDNATEENIKGEFKTIGITGGVGCGKSTVMNYIEHNYKGALFITDIMAYVIMRGETDCFNQIKELFDGYDIYNNSGSFDSTKIGKIIFKDDEKRIAMNKIVHPKVIDAVKEGFEIAREDDNIDFAVVESALLIESGLDKICDEIWYVTAPIDVRIKRLRQSRSYTEKKTKDIAKNQLSEDEFKKIADVVIENGDRFSTTYNFIDEIMKRHHYQKNTVIYDSKDVMERILGDLV